MIDKRKFMLIRDIHAQPSTTVIYKVQQDKITQVV